MPPASGRNVLGLRAQLGYVQGFGGDVAPPNNRFYSGGEGELRGFDVRGATPYGYVPNRVSVQLTNPDGSCVPRDTNNPQDNQCIQVPLPVYGVASIGGDTNLNTNARVPHSHRRPGHLLLLRRLWHRRGNQPRTVEAEPRGLCLPHRAALRLPGLQQRLLPGRHPRIEVGFQQDIRPISGTNFVPRMSLGGELSVIMPIINAPFRLYYAYNPLRLYETPYCNNVLVGGKQGSCSAS